MPVCRSPAGLWLQNCKGIFILGLKKKRVINNNYSLWDAYNYNLWKPRDGRHLPAPVVAELHPALSPLSPRCERDHRTNEPMELHQAGSSFWSRINSPGNHPIPLSMGQSFAHCKMLKVLVLWLGKVVWLGTSSPSASISSRGGLDISYLILPYCTLPCSPLSLFLSLSVLSIYYKQSSYFLVISSPSTSEMPPRPFQNPWGCWLLPLPTPQAHPRVPGDGAGCGGGDQGIMLWMYLPALVPEVQLWRWKTERLEGSTALGEAQGDLHCPELDTETQFDFHLQTPGTHLPGKQNRQASNIDNKLHINPPNMKNATRPLAQSEAGGMYEGSLVLFCIVVLQLKCMAACNAGQGRQCCAALCSRQGCAAQAVPGSGCSLWLLKKAESSPGFTTASRRAWMRLCQGSAQPSPSYLLRLQVFRTSFLLRTSFMPLPM